MLNVFISGLERQSGKTLVAAGLAATMQSLSYSTSVYKPVQTGAKIMNGFKSSPDLAYIKHVDANINVVSTYMLSSTHSPFVGAYEDQVSINVDTIYNEFRALSNTTDCNIIEGCNSISSPIQENITELDIVRGLRVPLILTVNPSITPIDRVISGINFIVSNKINFLGIIITQYDENSENLEEKYFPQILKQFSNVNVLGILPNYGDIAKLAPESLISDILNNVKIEDIFRVKIAKLCN